MAVNRGTVVATLGFMFASGGGAELGRQHGINKEAAAHQSYLEAAECFPALSDHEQVRPYDEIPKICQKLASTFVREQTEPKRLNLDGVSTDAAASVNYVMPTRQQARVEAKRLEEQSNLSTYGYGILGGALFPLLLGFGITAAAAIKDIRETRDYQASAIRQRDSRKQQ